MKRVSEKLWVDVSRRSRVLFDSWDNKSSLGQARGLGLINEDGLWHSRPEVWNDTVGR